MLTQLQTRSGWLMASRVSWRELARRELWWFLTFAIVVTLSFLLTPSPSLYGTHTELGLPQCPTMALFHVRCPTCGLTTSFAASARGLWGMAFQAHPAGPVLWVLTVIAAGYYLVQIVTRTRLQPAFSANAQNRILFWSFIVVVLAGIGRSIIER